MGLIGLALTVAVADKGIDMMLHPDRPLTSMTPEAKWAAHEAGSIAQQAGSMVLHEAENILAPSGPGAAGGRGGQTP
jgi:hypothetical protein